MFNSIIRMGSRVGLKLVEKAPQILTGAGIAGFIGTAVLASRATLRCDDIKTETDFNMMKARNALKEYEGQVTKDTGEPIYDQKDFNNDRLTIYSKAAVQYVKLYAPTVVLGLVSVACILSAHHILSKRLLTAMASLAGVQEMFNRYRGRVRDELGIDADRKYLLGKDVETATEAVTDEKGKTKNLPVDRANPRIYTEHAVIFDETNRNWSKDAGTNKLFVMCQQNWANERLKRRGYLFLNEVLEDLGFDRTPIGQLVGWDYYGDGDKYVDFGLFTMDDNNQVMNANFVNGFERSVVLDFNVDERHLVTKKAIETGEIAAKGV